MDQFTREIIVQDRIRELRREAEQRGRQNGAKESLSVRLSSVATALLRRGGRDHRVAEPSCGMNCTADAKHA
jgi:hypothetical protein